MLVSLFKRHLIFRKRENWISLSQQFVIQKSYHKVSSFPHLKGAVTPLRSLQKCLNSVSHAFFR